MNFTSPHYDNDEVMAKLGREMVDMTIGLRQKNCDEEGIAAALLVNLDQYIEEDEPDDDERDDGDQGDDTPEAPDGP